MRQGTYISREKIIRTYKDGKMHSEKHPAMYHYAPNSTFEHWYKNGVLHRVGGPAIHTYDYGFEHFYWYQNGLQHREDGPAVVWTREGVISLVDWCLLGKHIPKCKSVADLKRFKLKAFL